jgi:prepilin-type N-terminal cleavage/methylation domain-containing protein
MRTDSLSIGFPILCVSRESLDSRRLTHGSRAGLSAARYGVTLLELMVALGLLAMLLLVAWSLFDNLQKAEERSDGLAHRVQVLRQVRSWLTDDLDQLVVPKVDLNGNVETSENIYFTGDPTGFIATISPSLDPLPFLEDAFESSANNGDSAAIRQSEDEAELASVYDTDQDRQVRSVRRSPWALERVSVEYLLEPQSNAFQNATGTQSEDVLYGLVRRERLPVMGVPFSSPGLKDTIGGTNAMSGAVAPADRQLTIRDLYRQTDEALDNRGPVLREKSLPGIQNAEFRYFDGTAWSSQWDSRKQNAFPVAVAVQFDFPSRSKQRRDKAQRNADSNSSTEAEVSSEQSFGSIDTLLSQQTQAQTEITDSNDFLITTSITEVTIVVATHFRTAKWKREELESALRDDTRSNQGISSGRSP